MSAEVERACGAMLAAAAAAAAADEEEEAEDAGPLRQCFLKYLERSSGDLKRSPRKR